MSLGSWYILSSSLYLCKTESMSWKAGMLWVVLYSIQRIYYTSQHKVQCDELNTFG